MAWIEKTGPTLWRVRWRRPDGTTGSVTGFRSEKAANNYADEIECDQRRGTWLDPSGFRTTLADWVIRWWTTPDLDTRTLENYDSYLRCHILPRFGTTPMGTITTLDIKLWTKEAAEDGYAQATISNWVNLLSMILTDAVDQRLIPANPDPQASAPRPPLPPDDTGEDVGHPGAGPARRRPSRPTRRPPPPAC